MIYYVVRNGVQTFILQTEPEEDYKLPSSLFNCPTLKHLNLWGCKINLSSSFRGFSLLASLTLVDVVISVEALQTLVSTSRSLIYLQLKTFIDIRYIKFDTPKLMRFLYYHSSETQNSLHPVNNLPKQTICKLFDGFPCIQSLFFNGGCLKVMLFIYFKFWFS